MLETKLPLRVGVGVIVLNSKNLVFVGRRADNPADMWQMPQGGVEKNEYLLGAMKRELYEETSIKSIEVLKELDKWLEYELPKNLLGKIWKGQFRGQKQKWFIARYTGDESEINVNTKCPEFIDWKWIKMDELPKVAVHFKKQTYKKLLSELKKFID